MSLTIEAFAKVNLTLEVYGKRPDGYHALKSVVQPVSLADTLTFEPVRAGEGACTTDTDYGEKDLIVKAAAVLASAVRGHAVSAGGRELPAYHVRVVKRIPVGGGLGGGSADAAAALRALNELWNLHLTPERLAELGGSVGSDVPALVLAQHYRQAVWMEGRGERVELVTAARPMPVGALPSRHLVLANPGVFTSTPEVFAHCRPRADFADWATKGANPVTKTHNLTLVNDLEVAAVALHPEICVARAALAAVGLSDVRMSGSGATVFGFAADEASARQAAAALRGQGYAAWPVTT